MEYIREVSKINGKNMVQPYYIWMKLKNKKIKKKKQRKYILTWKIFIRFSQN